MFQFCDDGLPDQFSVVCDRTSGGCGSTGPMANAMEHAVCGWNKREWHCDD